MDQLFVGEEWNVYISTQQSEVIPTPFIQRTLRPKFQIFESYVPHKLHKCWALLPRVARKDVLVPGWMSE